jgi:hypothetical protein
LSVVAMTALVASAVGPIGVADAAGSVANGSLHGVSCPSATECLAVGSGFGSSSATNRPLVERWNGANWRVMTTPKLASTATASLSAISCPSTTACFAVGSLTLDSGRASVLAERWNGTSWVVESLPNPTGYTNPKLSGVSCPSIHACMAVGSSTNPSGQTVPLAERWNGTNWVIQSPAPLDSGDNLTAVSCTSPMACTAVGYGRPQGVAERWNGRTWTLQSTPGLGDMAGGGFDSVSCASGTACTATGSVDLGGGVPVQLAERWNGSIWVVQSTPNPGAFADMAGVSCPSRSDCTAVGYDVNFNTGADETFAMQFTGGSWTLQSPPTPADATDAVLLGVSCSAAGSCTGVGAMNGQSRTLAVRFNGTSWSVQPTP